MKNKKTDTFLILTLLYITLFIISNFITIKILDINGFIFNSGDLIFPIIYVLSDVIVEIYGKEKSKNVLKYSIIMQILVLIILKFVIALPKSKFFIYQKELEIIFGFTPKVIISSLIAYFLGNIINIVVMLKMKNKSSKLFNRIILSSFLGELIDTSTFILLVFFAELKMFDIIIMIFTTFSFKLAIEVLFSPITIYIINQIKIKEAL